jgi:phosphoenolpyruvate-protein kinase (PTS system EI component)
VVLVAHEAGRRVTVCGEMAADPDGALALSALQVDSLSVPVIQLTAGRRPLAEQLGNDLTDLAQQLIGLPTADEARELLRRFRTARPELTS